MKVKDLLGLISWGQRFSIMKLENEKGREIFSDFYDRKKINEDTKNMEVISIYAEENWLTLWVTD